MYFLLSLVDLLLEAISSNVSFLTVASLHTPEHLPLKAVQFLNVSLCVTPRTEPNTSYIKTNAEVELLSKETDFCDQTVQGLELPWALGLLEFLLFSLYTIILFEIFTICVSFV